MKSLVYYNGEWSGADLRLIGPMDHAFWMATSVFDGARAFAGKTPDLLMHCERLIASAKGMLLEPTLTADEIQTLCLEGVGKFDHGSELYIRPMFFAREGFVIPISTSTEFTLAIHELAMPEPGQTSICFSRYQRPSRMAAPTDIKAGCLYPNLQRALRESNQRGFDNCITFDPSGNVAELATANFWIVKDGIALTPYCNGTFLNGITRQRVMKLLNEDGISAREATLTPQDVMDADEIFSSGNYGKVLPITRLEDREIPAGPITKRARELYFLYAARS